MEFVTCPSCKFDQPLDDFCAQCGIPLRKALAIEKLKRSKQQKRIFIFSTLFAICLIASIVVLNKSLSKKEQNVFPAKAVVKELGARKKERTEVEVKIALEPTINNENQKNEVEEGFSADIKVGEPTKPKLRATAPTVKSLTDATEEKVPADIEDDSVKSITQVGSIEVIEASEECPVFGEQDKVTANNFETISNCTSSIWTISKSGASKSENEISFDFQWSQKGADLVVEAFLMQGENQILSAQETVFLSREDFGEKGVLIRNPFLGYSLEWGEAEPPKSKVFKLFPNEENYISENLFLFLKP